MRSRITLKLFLSSGSAFVHASGIRHQKPLQSLYAMQAGLRYLVWASIAILYLQLLHQLLQRQAKAWRYRISLLKATARPCGFSAGLAWEQYPYYSLASYLECGQNLLLTLTRNSSLIGLMFKQHRSWGTNREGQENMALSYPILLIVTLISKAETALSWPS